MKWSGQRMQYVKLCNGLNVLFHPMLNTHSVTIGLYVKAGSCYEKENQQGITHFLEHLHFRRCGSMSQEELYYRMESIGTDLRGKTYGDFLEFSMKLLPDKLEEGLSVFQEIIAAEAWSEEEFEKERQVVLNQIREKGDYFFLEEEVRKCVFRGSQMAGRIIGTMESVQALCERDIAEYKKKIFNKKNLIVCITGCVGSREWEIVGKKLEAVDLPDGAERTALAIPQVFHCRKPDIVFGVAQDRLLDVNLSFDISGKEEIGEALTILNCILGEGTGSNLQKRIRESLCYTSDIYSYVEKYQGFAVLHIRFSVERKLLLQCLKEVVGVMNQAKKNITLENLETSLPFYIDNKVFWEDDTVEMNFQLAYQEFILGESFEKEGLKKNEETILRLQKLAQLIFRPCNASVVIIGNTTRITKKSIRYVLGDL